ncbi:hypothetical protein [Nocardia sp. bgisy134]|uniref:hypothetical protein n=1 Tax=unclassified Nocardia TaxID=2637762 RepID=UPI003D734479
MDDAIDFDAQEIHHMRSNNTQCFTRGAGIAVAAAVAVVIGFGVHSATTDDYVDIAAHHGAVDDSAWATMPGAGVRRQVPRSEPSTKPGGNSGQSKWHRVPRPDGRGWTVCPARAKWC